MPACAKASEAVNINKDKDFFIVAFSLEFSRQTMPVISDTVTMYFFVPL